MTAWSNDRHDPVLAPVELRGALSLALYTWDGDSIVTAVLFAGPVPVANIRWCPDDGGISMITTDPQHRKRGYATALWDAVQGVSPRYGWTPPVHSDPEEQSDDARAWIAAMEGRGGGSGDDGVTTGPGSA